MIRLFGLFCYSLVLLFGIAMTVCFLGIKHNRKNIIRICSFFVLSWALQFCSWWLFGLETTKALYPLLIHFPLFLFVTAVFKVSPPAALSAIFSSYLCLQLPVWIGTTGELIWHTEISYYLGYTLTLIPWYCCLRKYVSAPFWQIISGSGKSCLLLGAMPCFYYLFDYVTVVYTDWLYSGSKTVIQLMMSVISLFYFLFIFIYYVEMQKEAAVQRERDFVLTQLEQAKVEFRTLSQMQEQTRQYRHDMRHHFALLQGMAAKGSTEEILSYLQTTQSDLDHLTPVRYCGNETVNLLLSSFQTIAKQSGVVLTAEAAVPETLSLSNTELCSLLSNSLENAVKAAQHVSVQEKRIVSVRIAVHKNKLLLSVKNPYEGKVIIRDGLPQSEKENHGYGTRSIAALAELHGGQALFAAENNEFSLKAMIPLKQQDGAKPCRNREKTKLRREISAARKGTEADRTDPKDRETVH